MPSTLIFIVGPTAIGKTAFAVKLAKRINGEVISSDSMQIYKGMSVLNQAPGPAEKKSVKHHLVGSLDPKKEYSAADFRKRAAGIIEEVIRRKKIPIVAGGSGLYVKGLVDGLFPSPKADKKFRKKMGEFALKAGSGKLHEKLRKIDPESARLIHPNDKRRIIRALEIYNATARTMTELKSRTRGLSDNYDIKIYGLIKPREEIYSSINSRVEKMFEYGLVREVRSLKRKRLSMTAKGVLGYKEITGYINGDYDLDTAKELLKRNTRRFAKRQLAWFRADDRIKWFDMSRTSEKEIIREIIREAVKGEIRVKKGK